MASRDLRAAVDAAVLHERTRRIMLVERYPAHEPRQHDPHYHAFNAARRRMRAAGLLRCTVCGACSHVELHHAWVEFAIQNAVDVEKLDEAAGLHLSDEEFKDWVESPGNLEPLCVLHHRGLMGVHNLPEPDWRALRIQDASYAPLAQILPRD